MTEEERWRTLFAQLRLFAQEHDLTINDLRVMFDIGVVATQMAAGMQHHELLPDERVGPMQ